MALNEWRPWFCQLHFLLAGLSRRLSVAYLVLALGDSCPLLLTDWCSVQQVPEESQLVFRGHQAHVESCCFITNGEFLSGSDDGSVCLWSTLKKKPVSIAHGAHGGVKHHMNGDFADGEMPTEQSSTLALANGNDNGISSDCRGSCLRNPLNVVYVPVHVCDWVLSVFICKVVIYIAVRNNTYQVRC